jgi:hypothetical protein
VASTSTLKTSLALCLICLTAFAGLVDIKQFAVKLFNQRILKSVE